LEAAVYLLGTFVALACGLLLGRGYRQSRQRLLLWSSICFLGLSLSNLLTFIDLSLLPFAIDLHLLRRAVTAIAMLMLVYGLIWDSE
jgi:uncharacterized paraquat-inducible protein A